MPGKIKVNFKMPPETAAEKMHRRQQELRKKSGLPDPEHYKKLAAQKQKEIDAMKNEETEQLEEGMIGRVISKVINKLHSSNTKKPLPQASDRRTFEKPKMEEVEQLDEMPESSMKTRDVHAHLKKSGWTLKRTGGGHDVYSHPKSKEHIAVPRHKQLKAPLIRGIMKASRVSEETEIEEQLHKKGKFVSGPVKKPYKSSTVVTPIREAKDAREYDYEGDMAMSQLRSLIFNAEDMMDLMEENTNLPEWVQSKVTLAEDYISTTANYLRGELTEEVALKEARFSGLKPNFNKKEPMKHYGPEEPNEPDEIKNTYHKEKRERILAALEKTRQERFPHLKKEEFENLDEKKNLPGLWANIHAKRKRGEPPAKPGDKDYPKTLNIESSENQVKEETDDLKGACWKGYTAVGIKVKNGRKVPNCVPIKEETDEPSAAARTLSRKAQIVKNIAKNKKKDQEEASDKFQKDPELSSDMQKT